MVIDLDETLVHSSFKVSVYYLSFRCDVNCKRLPASVDKMITFYAACTEAEAELCVCRITIVIIR